MNPFTGHMTTVLAGTGLSDGYLPVPKELRAEAEAALAGKAEAQIDLRARGPLQAWAKKKRKEKIAAKSRRANRSR